MSLEHTYQKIKPSIVAFIPKFHPIYKPNQSLPEFPPIFGTGFIITDGLVVTNDHVVSAIGKLPRPKDCPTDVWPVIGLLLYLIPGKGIAEIPLDVIGAFKLQKMIPGKAYYGPKKPDIGFVHVKMKDLPKVNVKYEPKEIKEGREVATAGFPMGTDTLMAPGYLHQLTPTLQRGVISAILPFDCESPHSLMINVMTQGGASGSPVFLPESGDVIGVLYGGLNDIQRTKIKHPKDPKEIDPSLHSHIYKIPTNASYVVPSHYIIKVLESLLKDKNLVLPADTPSLKQLLGSAKFVERKRGESSQYKIWEKDEEATERKVKKIELTKEKTESKKAL